jgi:hypothetical protein
MILSPIGRAKSCSVCGRAIVRFHPLPEEYSKNRRKYGCPYPLEKAETLNVNEYSSPFVMRAIVIDYIRYTLDVIWNLTNPTTFHFEFSTLPLLDHYQSLSLTNYGNWNLKVLIQPQICTWIT